MLRAGSYLPYGHTCCHSFIFTTPPMVCNEHAVVTNHGPKVVITHHREFNINTSLRKQQGACLCGMLETLSETTEQNISENKFVPWTTMWREKLTSPSFQMFGVQPRVFCVVSKCHSEKQWKGSAVGSETRFTTWVGGEQIAGGGKAAPSPGQDMPQTSQIANEETVRCKWFCKQKTQGLRGLMVFCRR